MHYHTDGFSLDEFNTKSGYDDPPFPNTAPSESCATHTHTHTHAHTHICVALPSNISYSPLSSPHAFASSILGFRV